MNTKKNLIRFDWAMKRLLRNKANFTILEGFLSELLKETIKIKNLLESESNQDTPFSKFNRVDLLAENSKGELILIEVQNDREIDYFQRMLFGVSKLITEHIQLGEDYINIKKVYSVNIIYFDLGQGTDYIYHGYTHFEGIHHHDDLLLSQRQQSVFNVEKPAGIMPEFYIIKVNQFDDIAKNTLDEWVFYLKNNIIEENFSAQGLDKVRQVLKIESMTKQDQANYGVYLSDLSHERSIIFTAKDEGKAEGKIEKQLEIAQNLLTLGLGIESIIQATGLTLAEVKDLSKANQ